MSDIGEYHEDLYAELHELAKLGVRGAHATLKRAKRGDFDQDIREGFASGASTSLTVDLLIQLSGIR